ncbi:MAG TPA: glutamate synthase subunit alpha, partial [Chloroflexi bacterium]|nr:glutamate synthase subunit alpha [Chloroflexota bacterium]
MLATDIRDGTLWHNREVKRQLAERKPYSVLNAECPLPSESTQAQPSVLSTQEAALSRLQRAFGYTSEELQVVLKPMVWEGHEPIGSMGDDTPQAVLSEQSRPLAHYFKQRFAEVTNPPIDPLREASFMSLRIHLGRWPALLESEPRVERLVLESPIITPALLGTIERARPSFHLDATFPVDDENGDSLTLTRALARLHNEAEAAIHRGVELLVLDDSATGPDRLPIPSVLAVASLHHHLIRKGLRTRCSLIAFSGAARDTHSLAVLIGYGANAVCPWLALATAEAIGAEGYRGERLAATETTANFLHASAAGLLKIMSKMGIATVESYCGAQIFEAIGLSQALVERHFAGTPSRVGGIGLNEIEAEVRRWHAAAFAGEGLTVAHEHAIAGLAPQPGSRREQ